MQVVVFILKDTVPSWGLLPGGFFPPLCVRGGRVGVFVCATEGKKRALRAAVPVLPGGCLLTVPFTSQHQPGCLI